MIAWWWLLVAFWVGWLLGCFAVALFVGARESK